MVKNDIFFETRRMGRKRKKNPLLFFFFQNFHFLGVFFHFFCFFLGVSEHVLRPPCWRQRDKSVTKKIENPKILDTWFFVFRYSKPFGAHATSNVCIYYQKKLFYGHPVGDTEVASLQKRQIIKKYWTAISAFFDIRSRLALTQPRMFIYRYIYIYNNKSQFTATLQEIQKWLFYKKDR